MSIGNMVLIPGYMTDDRLWDKIAGPLEQQGAVLTLAQLDEGETMAEMAERIIESCPPRFVLLGFSMGGYIARQILRRIPERVSSLILVATSSRADSETQQRIKAAAAKAVTAKSYNGLGNQSLGYSLHPDRSHDPDLLQQLKGMGQRLGYEVFVRQSRLDRDSDTQTLSQITCPTLIIAAQDDRMRSFEEAAELQEHIAGAMLRVIPDCGHMIPLEQPAALCQEIIDWLADRPQA
ncbi:alpha/beta fold hydrolase [Rouxiella chamberiensis]|uniref:Alpha/beta hydrolase n=1 Tax=Rouxiella chamberiensis TaxID=1513468 RepID=A0ABY7HSQ4_9GAMM|nr:alpha/beta hydrolase [Rouxiella chamberiensis]WAT02428.1 alpha/beta hydrolase [Rouxiella chamberiensis]